MFNWNAANRKHVAKHGVEPSEAEEAITNWPIDIEMQLRNGEERTLQIGETNNCRVLVVVTAWRGKLIRVVTAYPAPTKVRKFYAAQKAKNDEKREIKDP